MALVKFVKIRMVGWKPFRDDILKELQKTGAVEIVKASEEDVSTVEETSEELDLKLSQVEFCLKSFSAYHKKGVLESLLPGKMEVGFSEYRKAVDAFPLDNVYEGCRRREDKLRELAVKAERLKTKFQEFVQWRELDVTPRELKGTEKVELILLRVPRRFLDSLTDGIEKIGSLDVVEETKTTISCLLICLRRERDSVDKLLKDCACLVVRLPEADDSEISLKVPRILEKIKRRLLQIEESMENLRKEAEKSSSDIGSLLILQDHLSNIRRRKDVLGELGFTHSVFVLDGWVKQKDLDHIVARIEKKFPEIHVEVREPEEGEVPPVELENKKVVEPFEAVTGLYGLPDHREMDPTPLVAPFFALFFALCLTDAGYGLILTILGLVCLKKLNLSKGGRQLVKLLTTAGMVTIVVGCLTGGIFGFQFEELPEKLEFLRTFRNSLMVVDLSSFVSGAGIRPVLMLFVLSLGLGFVQVWLGFFMKMYQELRNRNLKDAVFDQLPWLIILPGFIILGLVKKPDVILLGLVDESPLGSSHELAGRLMILVGFFGMLLKPGGGNILKRIGLVIYRFYDGIVGCFSNIISYVRLFALGMTTLAMAVATNTIAGIVMKIPKVGIVVAIPVLIGGHLFNVIINTLGGFIHTVRLQFVEFFTKFYQGGGRTFRPFAIENKHVEIVEPQNPL